uniref:Uncharacterized protein n=1 Tax=Molossus molossus TaxID=27622 RepID=A0A7J8JV58_MOLMO|nr:hypothetical protein HJG59_007792 [Molossus molossus]
MPSGFNWTPHTELTASCLAPCDKEENTLFRLNDLLKVTDPGSVKTIVPWAISEARRSSSSVTGGGRPRGQWGCLPGGGLSERRISWRRGPESFHCEAGTSSLQASQGAEGFNFLECTEQQNHRSLSGRFSEPATG